MLFYGRIIDQLIRVIEVKEKKKEKRKIKFNKQIQ